MVGIEVTADGITDLIMQGPKRVGLCKNSLTHGLPDKTTFRCLFNNKE